MSDQAINNLFGAELEQIKSADVCPRCEEPMDEPIYGPCQKCRIELRKKYSSLPLSN